MKLFISYSRDDKVFVYDLAQQLRDEGQHDVWIDQRLVGADVWWDTILKAIEDCECFVMMLSPKCVASIYSGGELDYALALKKPILPLMIKPCDVPVSLKAIQYTDINGLSIMESLLRTEKALSRIEIRLIKGEYPTQVDKPPRPPVPEPQAKLEHLYEVFSAAEEAFAANDSQLAEKLFSQVIQNDPQGLGQAATERLGQLRLDRERVMAYTQIIKLADNPTTLKGARAAWKVYVQKYGIEYDPNGYALKLSENPAMAVRGEESPYHAGVFTRPDRRPPPTLPEEPGATSPAPGHPDIIRVWVPAGCFYMGSEPTDEIDFPDEQPQHEVCIAKGFWLDQIPVTNAMYQAFIEAGGYAERKYWSGAGWRWRQMFNVEGPTDYDGLTEPDLPRVGITWFEAEAYARWRGGRLPTEAEWEYAARGPQSLIYPWGNEFDITRLNTESDVGRTTPGKTYENGKSWVGAYDMSGNVWEWVADWYDETYYKQEVRDDPKGPASGSRRVVRGAAWDYNRKNCHCAYRFPVEPENIGDDVGLRVLMES